MNTNTWYYTLSTIAQTLAAILGLAAVFVSLKLEGIVEDVFEYKKRALRIFIAINKHINNFPLLEEPCPAQVVKVRLNQVSRDYDSKYMGNSGVPAELEKISNIFEPNRNFSATHFLWSTHDNLDRYIEQRLKLLHLIKWPGIVAALTIFLALGGLAVTDYLNYSKAFIFIIAGLAILSIFLIIRASWKLIQAEY